nr:immunoglobulin heavy chain junction region [Macaca mulatta]
CARYEYGSTLRNW